ncbi:MAG: hypothetical protein N2205_08775, partial [Candidatus Caldatribacterium sp.]|nr:hypothetical protein [Candidatus Caldatribacterium sp.]
RIALALRHKMKELYGKSKIYFLSFQRPGTFAALGFAEVSKERPQATHKRWFALLRDLWRRRRFRERRVFIGRNLWLLALVVLFGGRKVTVVLPLGGHPFAPSAFWMSLLRRLARVVFADDALFVQELRNRNIPAYFVGNLLADLVEVSGAPFLHGKKPICALFPRKDHLREDLGFFLELAEQVAICNLSLYFLCNVPRGVSIEAVRSIAFEKGWVFLESFEGEVIEGYLVHRKAYLNLTRFASEALCEATYVVSADRRVLIQAVGLGKTVVPVQVGKAAETAELFSHPVALFEYNQAMGAQFGKRGAIERIASFLLFGVVEDPAFIHRLR